MSCRYDKTLETYHESNATDAKRYDIIHGVDPLSATIFDRSISRAWPITSWSMEISTNNARLSWYPTMTCTITSAPDYWNGQDIQALFVPLTSRLWRYGNYAISLITVAGAHDPETDPQPMGPILMNNNRIGSNIGILGQYGYYTRIDYDNLPTPLNSNVSAHWNYLSRYSRFIVSGLPFGYDFLNGIQVESIYLDNPAAEGKYLPPNYTWPTGTPTDHQCNRAYFEVWGCNSVANRTFTLYLCSSRDVYGETEPAPHQEITWLRLMKDGSVLYSDTPKDRIITIPWPTTPP